MENIRTLSRNEMKHIMAGGACRLAFRYDDGSFAGYSGCDYSPGQAQFYYGGGIAWPIYDNMDVSGYCCESCGSDGFSNAQPC